MSILNKIKNSHLQKKLTQDKNGQPKPKKGFWQKWKSLKKRWKFLLIVALLIGGSIAWSKISTTKKVAANREIVQPVRQDLRKEAIRSGQVELQGVVKVTPPISGVVTELLVENGQEVTEGETLFKIKSNATAAEKSAAWSSYLSAKNAYETAKIESGTSEWNNFESAKQAMIAVEEEVRLFEEHYPEKKNNDNKEYQQLKLKQTMTRRTLDAATLEPNQVNSRLSAARASYNASLAAYNASIDGTYDSPISGRIENLGINEGENVLAKVGDEAGTPLFLIVPDGSKTISMQIGPNDALALQVGQSATVKSDYVKEATFAATIARVDKVGTTTEKGLTYRAWLEVDDARNQLLLGTPIEISLITGEKSQVLTLPIEAIVDNNVTLVNDKGEFLETRPVVTGLKADGIVEIISGLSETDSVLIDRNLL